MKLKFFIVISFLFLTLSCSHTNSTLYNSSTFVFEETGKVNWRNQDPTETEVSQEKLLSAIEQLQVGDSLRVKLDHPATIFGSFFSGDSATLILKGQKGEQRIPIDDILQISVYAGNATKTMAIVVGIVGGLAGGVRSGMKVGFGEDWQTSGDIIEAAVVGALIGGAVGAAIGAGLGSLTTKWYRRYP